MGAQAVILLGSDVHPGAVTLPALLYLIGVMSYYEFPIEFSWAGFAGVFMGSMIVRLIKMTRVS